MVHRVTIGGTKVHIRTGEYAGGKLGEVFVTLSKEGSELRVYDAVAIAISIGLQYGVPLEEFVDKFKHQKMEPSGWTSNPAIPHADSIVDYLARWLEIRYLGGEG